MNEHELIELRNTSIYKLEKIIARGKLESRALTGDEQNQFNQLKDQVTQIDKLLQSLKMNMDDFSGGGSSAGGGSASGQSGQQTRAKTSQEITEERAFL